MKYNETIIPKHTWEQIYALTYLNPDNSPDLKKIKVTLYLYHVMQEKVSAVYDEITMGEINDPQAAPHEVLEIVEEIECGLVDSVRNDAIVETRMELSKFNPN